MEPKSSQNPSNHPMSPDTTGPREKRRYLFRIGLSVALGGFLMGFDASVISGVVRFIRPEFGLTDLQLGFAVSSLTLTATLAMLSAGPLSDKIGRRAVLIMAAVLYAVSAVASALADNFIGFVVARMIGGLGVGASLIIAPMYLAEIAPAKSRGRLVSLNQLNIVIGISAAFFSNYLILTMAEPASYGVTLLGFSMDAWRWMLAIETVPALLFFLALFGIPQSPRWLVMKGRREEATQVLGRIFDDGEVASQVEDIALSLERGKTRESVSLKALMHPGLRWLLLIGFGLAILQQITGINAVFFYAPMIFEQSGISADAAFLQAVLVGLTNLVFTIFAMLLIDRIGRRPLLLVGMLGIMISMLVLSHGFGSARYELTPSTLEKMTLPSDIRTQLSQLEDKSFASDTELTAALVESLGPIRASEHQAQIIQASIQINAMVILLAILGFIASFAISIGPVMWVMFSELFPLHIRGLAVSLAGFVNSLVSFLVQLLFPLQLASLGSSPTFLLYGLFAALGWVFVWKYVPETRHKSLEQLDFEFSEKKGR